MITAEEARQNAMEYLREVHRKAIEDTAKWLEEDANRTITGQANLGGLGAVLAVPSHLKLPMVSKALTELGYTVHKDAGNHRITVSW